MLDLRCFPRVHKTKPFSLSHKCSKLLTRGGGRTQRKTLFYLIVVKKKKKKKKTHLKLCNTESTILTIFKCTAQQQHVSSPRCVEFQNFSIRKPEAQAHSMQMPLLQPLVTTFYFSASMILDNFGYFLKLESDGVCPL